MSIQLIGGLLIILLGAVILFGVYWTDAPTPCYILPLVIVFVGSVISADAAIDAKLKAVEEANPTTETIYQEIVVENKRYVLAEDTIIIDGNTYVLAEDLNNTEE